MLRDIKFLSHWEGCSKLCITWYNSPVLQHLKNKDTIFAILIFPRVFWQSCVEFRTEMINIPHVSEVMTLKYVHMNGRHILGSCFYFKNMVLHFMGTYRFQWFECREHPVCCVRKIFLLQQMHTHLLERCSTWAKHSLCLCVIYKELY